MLLMCMIFGQLANPIKVLASEIIPSYDLNIELDLDENVCFTGYRENYHTVVDNIIDNAKRYAKSTIKIILKKPLLGLLIYIIYLKYLCNNPLNAAP